MKVLLIGILLISVFCSGCATLNPFSGPANKPATYYEKEKEKSSTPVIVVDKKGKVSVSYKKVKRERIIRDRKELRYGFFQRLQYKVSNLTSLGFIILILGVVLFPSTVIGWLGKKSIEVKNALFETVKAISESGAKDNSPPLHDALKVKQSKKTKAIVGKMKAQM